MSQSVAEFLGEFYNPADLQQFLQLLGVPDITSVRLVGPNNETQPGFEATLDIQVRCI